jgi:acyl-CoA thioesterase
MHAFFQDRGDGRFSATELTRGPWDHHSQHAGPPAALLARCLEVAHPRSDAQIARIAIDILRPVPIGELDVAVEVLRPGRSIELLAATARCDGQEVLRATAWRIRTEGISVHVPPPDVPARADPDTLPQGPFFAGAAAVGYHTGMDFRFAEGGFDQQGPAAVWMRMAAPLLADEEPSPLVRVLIAADSSNGVSGVADPRELLYVNTDLTVALHRPPVGAWVLLDARTVIEPHGIGQAAARIADRTGTIGMAIQTLFVAQR